MRNLDDITPRGLNRAQAARYIGVSPGTFDSLVSAGKMPRPKRPSPMRKVWDMRALDDAFDALPGADDDANNPLDQIDEI